MFEVLSITSKLESRMVLTHLGCISPFSCSTPLILHAVILVYLSSFAADMDSLNRLGISCHLPKFSALNPLSVHFLYDIRLSLFTVKLLRLTWYPHTGHW